MVRSMYAGVSGMKAHQSKMDVIGNNISNVNTYGFKSSRTTFKDIYYTTITNATGSSAVRGGVNPSQIGYGATLGGIDVMHGRGTLTMTDRGMDAMIVGEGFFQVQDSEGNIFYTKAGNMTIDPSGNLVDMNGYFVLGVSGNPLGQAPNSGKIQINIPPVNPSVAKAEEIINNATFKIRTSNSTKESNLTLNIISSSELPLGQEASAEVTTSGITVKLNANMTFASLSQLQQAINKAVTEANGGKEHPAGQLTIECADEAKLFGASGLSGEEIASKDFSPKLGSITGIPGTAFGGISFDTVSSSFGQSGDVAMACKLDETDPTNPFFEIEMTVDGGTPFTGRIPANATGAGKLLLKEPTTGESVTINHPGFTAMKSARDALGGGDFANIGGDGSITAKATEPSKALGLSSKAFKLTGGTEGGTQTVADCTSVSIGGDGIIEAIHPVHGRLQLGRVDLATFTNPQGLAQTGNSYFSATANSGKAEYSVPGTDGSGALQTGALEASNVDLSKEFSDMIVTQRGFQANSRLITVSDEMLEELVNLKR